MGKIASGAHEITDWRPDLMPAFQGEALVVSFGLLLHPLVFA